MNHPVWDLPYLGSGWIIGLISIVHVSIAHLVVGAGCWLALAEGRAQRLGDPDLQAWLRGRAKALLWLSGIFGAGTGVGIWVAIGLVNPTATQHLIRAFVMGWAIEWLLFVGEMATLIVLVQAYDRLRPRQRLAVTWLYALCAWLSLVVINGILTFMLSPGKSWTVSHNLWDGFFNATYPPSLLLRSCVALALGGLWSLAAGGNADPALKPRILKPAAQLTLAGVLLAPLAGWYYFHNFPLAAKALVLANLKGSAGLAQGLRWALWGLGAFLAPALLALWALLAPCRFRRSAALSGLLLACLGLGGFEWIREVARKPFVICEVMYSNGIRVDQVAGYQERGFLVQNAWARAFAESRGDTDLVRGEAILRSQCLACHTRDGYRSLKVLTAGNSEEDNMALVLGLRERDPALNPYLDFMPPFAGTAQEATLVGKYLSSLRGKYCSTWNLPGRGRAGCRRHQGNEGWVVSPDRGHESIIFYVNFDNILFINTNMGLRRPGGWSTPLAARRAKAAGLGRRPGAVTEGAGRGQHRTTPQPMVGGQGGWSAFLPSVCVGA